MSNELLIASIGLVGVVVGAVLAGAAAWFNSRFQHRYEEQRDRRRLFLEKIQDLYEVVSHYKTAYVRLTAEQIKTITARQPMTVPDVIVPTEKLHMLVSLYAPTLRPKLEKLIEASEKYSDVLVKTVGMDRQPDAARKSHVADVFRVQTQLRGCIEEMQTAIVGLSKNYIGASSELEKR